MEIKHVFENPRIVILRTSTDDSTERRLHILFDDIAEQYKALKPCANSVKGLLIHISFPISSPLLMSEMSIINEMVGMVIPSGLDCEVKWELSPREDCLCKITCAIYYNRQ